MSKYLQLMSGAIVGVLFFSTWVYLLTYSSGARVFVYQGF